MLKLNIGAGGSNLGEGWTNIDRKTGQEAYPLMLQDNCVDEIRASHILEHFSHLHVMAVLDDWVRTLKPGGLIRIAVPDFDLIVKEYRDDPLFEAYLFGSQNDDDNVHKALFTETKLRQLMELAGLDQIERWSDPDAADCSTLPVSLNLQGIKSSEPSAREIKIRGIMSIPRYGALAARGLIEKALHDHQIPIHTAQGVFWGQCMQRMFTAAVQDELDFIITVDYDTIPTAQHVAELLQIICSNDDIDALAALQPKRNSDLPLITQGKSEGVETDGRTPILATTAHFGLTVIRVESLPKVEKPWFYGKPSEDGSWEDDSSKMDDDIWFWHQWRKAGNTIYVAPSVRIGHLEETVSYYDENIDIQRCSVPEWREQFLRD